MATLCFEGESHGEIVVKVRRWLASIEGAKEGHLSPSDAINQGAELTKEALRILASSAPGPVAQNDVVKALTGAGYKLTDQTKRSMLESLDAIEQVTGGSVVKRVRDVRKTAVYEMNAAVARGILRALRP